MTIIANIAAGINLFIVILSPDFAGELKTNDYQYLIQICRTACTAKNAQNVSHFLFSFLENPTYLVGGGNCKKESKTMTEKEKRVLDWLETEQQRMAWNISYWSARDPEIAIGARASQVEAAYILERVRAILEEEEET